jgi:chromosome segregation ATPase
MSAELSKVRARVSAQERQATATAARIEEVAQDVEGIAGQVAEVKASIEALSQSVDHRFEHVYGELADIKANTVEIRNLLASLVAQLEKGNK